MRLEMDFFRLLKLIHILAVMMWFGAGVYQVVLSSRLRRVGEGPALIAVGRQSEHFGKTFFMPLAIITLVTGVLMVLDADVYAFSDAFVSIGFVGIVATAIIGPAVLSPTGARLADTVAERGPDAPEAQALKVKLRRFELLDLAILLVVTWAMVYRP